MASQAALAAVHAALKQDSGRADSLLAGLQAAGFSYSAEVKLESNEQEENLALAFRMALEESLVRNNAANRNAITDESVVALLDLSVEAAMRGWVPRQLPLMAMHELFEGQTAKQCGLAFEYLEKRVDKLSELTEQGEHKYSQAALLRCCNTLMQRLSKSSELLLCGRVLMFLAHILPLAEKSGVNLKGDFNKANVTEYEEELAGEEEERLAAEGGNAKEFKLRSTDEKLDGQMEVSYFLYKTFWGLQRFLHEPLAMITGPPGSLEEFVSGMGSVLDNFASYTHSDADGAAAHTAEREYYFPGFLTSTKLISLELQDPTFRRHVLVQYLIVLHYLADRASHPPKTPEVPKKMREEIPKLQERCFKQLSGIPPRGAAFVATLRRILSRENNWTTWKKAKCPDFSRGFDTDAGGPVLVVGDKRRGMDQAANVWKQRYFDPKKIRNFIPEAFKGGDILKMCKPKDRTRKEEPFNSTKLDARLAQVREDKAPENYIEDEYRKNNIPMWRWVTTRLLLSHDINLFSHLTPENKYLEGVVNHMDGTGLPAANKGANDALDDGAKDMEVAT